MIDDDQVSFLRAALIDRFSPDELVEVLGLDTEDIIERFMEEILRADWSEYL